jgi:peptide/nickel transport system ATP-binding protein
MRGRDIGMVFQEPMTALNPLMSIGDQAAETVLLHGAAADAERTRWRARRRPDRRARTDRRTLLVPAA